MLSFLIILIWLRRIAWKIVFECKTLWVNDDVGNAILLKRKLTGNALALQFRYFLHASTYLRKLSLLAGALLSQLPLVVLGQIEAAWDCSTLLSCLCPLALSSPLQIKPDILVLFIVSHSSFKRHYRLQRRLSSFTIFEEQISAGVFELMLIFICLVDSLFVYFKLAVDHRIRWHNCFSLRSEEVLPHLSLQILLILLQERWPQHFE